MTETLDTLLDSLPDLLEVGDGHRIDELLQALESEDVAYVGARLDASQLVRLVELLGAVRSDAAAEFLEHMQDAQVAGVLEQLGSTAAASIVEQLASNDRADVLSEMAEEHVQAILDSLPPEAAETTQRLIEYDAGTAGGLMIAEYLSHPSHHTVSQVLADMRENAERYARYDVQYVYVTDVVGRLEGVLRLRDLILSPGHDAVERIMIADPAHVDVNDGQERLDAFFDEHHFFAAPVVDADGRLVGVVRRAAVEEARAERADRTLLAFGGIIGGEELRSMSTRTRIARRLLFLCPNIVLNLVAASVIAVYEPTIAAVTALAIFLPMLSDMSGCAGNQAVAVSIRELALGVLKPGDYLYTLRKELWLGLFNGVVLGGLIGAIAWALRGGEWPLIGVVVGAAMAVNSVVAVVVGGTVPLALKRVGVDPALAASPLLTTVTDMCGFFVTLSMAAALLLGGT